jgi:hypothetical protein
LQQQEDLKSNGVGPIKGRLLPLNYCVLDQQHEANGVARLSRNKAAVCMMSPGSIAQSVLAGSW